MAKEDDPASFWGPAYFQEVPSLKRFHDYPALNVPPDTKQGFNKAFLRETHGKPMVKKLLRRPYFGGVHSWPAVCFIMPKTSLKLETTTYLSIFPPNMTLNKHNFVRNYIQKVILTNGPKFHFHFSLRLTFSFWFTMFHHPSTNIKAKETDFFKLLISVWPVNSSK